MKVKNNKKESPVYLFNVLDASSHKTVWVKRFTKTSLIWSVSVTLVILIIAIYSLIAFTGIKNTIPGYPDEKARATAVKNAIRIDSLQTIIMRWELYSENLRRVVDGEEPIKIDSMILAHRDRVRKTSDELFSDMMNKDSILRATVTEEEQFDLSTSESRKLDIEGLHFFTPLKGVISQKYEPGLHPYIDITAPRGSLVLSVLDGTVIFAGWNDESGYTIQVQHSSDIVSIYKHNQKLLKKTGDKVTAGTPIALVGNSGSLTTGDHLHFELWNKGEAVDPTLYIVF